MEIKTEIPNILSNFIRDILNDHILFDHMFYDNKDKLDDKGNCTRTSTTLKSQHALFEDHKRLTTIVQALMREQILFPSNVFSIKPHFS